MPFTFHLQTPAYAVLAGLLAFACVTALFRAPAFPRVARALAGLAVVALAIAAGTPTASLPGPPDEVVVMVDLSPSTRGATYRDPAQLARRVATLLDGRRHVVRYFAGATSTPTAPSLVDGALDDLPVGRTAFVPPPAGAVVLFSDARFEPPVAAPPTFVVVDPGLDRPADARVADLTFRDGSLVASFANASGERPLSWAGAAAAAAPRSLAAGSFTVTTPAAPGAARAVVRIAPGDRWPENDGMAAIRPPPAELERWWVGDGATDPGPGWTRVRPADLPTDPAALLPAAAIVLDGVPADALSASQQAQLDRYVRDLGGTVLVLGGPRAFAAGGYAGTVLDALSPLASNPPTPAAGWLILADASGSMAAPAPAGGTRFDAASAALRASLAALPPDDPVDVGSFARDVRWWFTGMPVRAARDAPFPPPGLLPNGATNLAAALDALASPGRGPRDALLLTDGGADPPDAAAAAARLSAAGVRLHVLSVADGPATASLAVVARGTGGSLVAEADPARWADAARRLVRAASPDRVERSPVTATFTDALSAVPPVTAALWNRTWARAGAAVVATAGEAPLAAWWPAGRGRVAAVALPAGPAAAGQVADLLARPPRDPRLRVTWSNDAVVVDATDAGRPTNGLALSLELNGSRPLAQVGPGRYAATFNAPARPAVATLLNGSAVVDRRALAGRHAPEFDAVGNDYVAMRALAARTGGRVVAPADAAPLDLPRSSRPTPLAPWFAAAGATLVAASLVAWRRG